MKQIRTSLHGGRRSFFRRWLSTWPVTFASLMLSAQAMVAMTFYVSPGGDDRNGDGSFRNPWQTLAGARDHIRTAGLNVNMREDIIVCLRGGRYSLTHTLAFTDADSGTGGFYITYQAYANEVATISGGRPITHWSPVPGKHYWVAAVPRGAGFADYFRQLYVNGIRAERAHSAWITSAGFFDDPATPQSVDGITFHASDWKNYSRVTDLRLLHISSFKVDEFPVTGITTNNANGLVQVELQQPYCQIRHDYGGGDQFHPTDRWMVVQALEELDEPGEWYLDRAARQVYYYPNPLEDMRTARVYAPVVETLVSLTGASTANKVQNLRFKNLVFEHGNWFFPRDYFIGGSQAEILMPDVPPNAGLSSQYGGEMPGQIVLNNTKGIQFIGNTIRHLGSCGIQPANGTRDTLIQGNVFYDLTGAAILGGRWGGDAVIPHQQICTNTLVADNVIRDTGGDFMASSLINNLNHYGFQVLHNDMADSQYMGFHQRTFAETLADSAGIGGTVVSGNRISMANGAARYGVGDCGYIYSFGVWPESVFQGNDINGIYYPKGTARGMMFDNKSYGLTAIGNVVRNVRPGVPGYFLYTSLTKAYKNRCLDNYGDATVNNFKAVTNINFHSFSGALPPEARRIVAAAGLEPGYTGLLQGIYAGTNLAQGRFAWASSQASAATPPAAAVDGDYVTRWQPADQDTNHCWWAVDLGAAWVIQRIEIAAQTNLDLPAARCHFQVQGASDPGFARPTLLAGQNSVPFAYHSPGFANSWVKYINEPKAFRYLRVSKTESGPLNFSEFQAFGCPAMTAPARSSGRRGLHAGD